MSSVAPALGIPEVLEHILGYLDWKTLLCSQRVARHWHLVINQSNSLQKILGLKPYQKREYWILEKNAIGMLLGTRRANEHDIQRLRSNELLLQRATATALMLKLADQGLGNPLTENFGTEYMLDLRAIPYTMFEDSPMASWRNMQCMQPPALSLQACTTIYHRDSLMFRRKPGHRGLYVIENESGVTIGQIIDLVKRWKMEAPFTTDWSIERFTFTAVGIIAQEAFFRRPVRKRLD